ncbi:uncharacterized protein si:ch211-10d23.5 [Girardinichthys multiradiatus]|uniref:uncharacterized protein si:ch211-10d23.5 n=1 Tax=Girardinichthys multiradiatus TaxID=208333 RepID=UPI001FAD45A4|nr:uncharacterized protein si:ch211-10d23.5 [Girardinichthys multiradiatus]
MEGSHLHQSYSDVDSFLACAAPQCVFCEKKELGNSGHLFRKHLREAIYFSDNNQGTASEKNRVVINYFFFAEKSETLKRKNEDTTDDATENTDNSSAAHSACPHCTALLSTPKNLQRHIRDVHLMETTPMICVDIRNELYVTPKQNHCPVLPIHVVKSTNPPKLDLRLKGVTNKVCKTLYQTSSPHICFTLQDMLSKGLMSSDWGLKCEQMDIEAKNSEVDSVFPVSFGDKGQSQRCFFFSVFTNEADSWCQFGRTRVMFDAVAGKWNCQCRGSGKSHCMMAIWWIFQESPGTLMATSDVQVEDIDDLESHMVDGGISSVPNSLNTQNICVMTEYFYRQKRIPSLQQLPFKLRTQEETPPPSFFPTESTCPYCPGPTPPELSPSKVVTSQAMMYGINYVKKGISVAEKQCPTCGNVVRFQEYASGFHKFNNNVFLTLPLCELLQSA